MQKAGDCDFFVWANKEMSHYEKGLAKYLKEMKDKRVADNNRFDAFTEEKCNQHYDKLRRDLELGQNDKVDAMIGKKNARNITINYSGSLGWVKIIGRC